MMAILSLLGKDAREHLLTALVLTAGCVALVMVALIQNRAAPFSMSPFEVVRFALLTFMPLVALIVGNRLVVREYLNGTRLFVEALPLGNALPLVLKYLLGMGFLILLCSVLVFAAYRMAGIADDVDEAYLVLMLGKTMVVASLYWSIVFCFSLCGHLRLALYLMLAGLVAFIAYYPGIDQSRLAPFALLDDQLFVYERDEVPWWDIGWTLGLSALFTIGGFVLASVGEGSVADRLTKPMTRRDFVALGVLFFTGSAVWATLAEKSRRESFEFSSDAVLRSDDPPISILYLRDSWKNDAEVLMQQLQPSLEGLQAALGIAAMPAVRVALDADREPRKIDYSTIDGVSITANWLSHDSYDFAVLEAVILHGMLSSLSNNRAVFEPNHWILDGFTRWWVEQGKDHRAELFARALFGLERFPASVDLVGHWQLTADKLAYPTAEALAYTALVFIEETRGTEVVLDLGRSFLTRPVGNSLRGALLDRRQSSIERFEQLAGSDWTTFLSDWHAWLLAQAQTPAILAKLQQIPAVTGVLEVLTDESGVHRVNGSYRWFDGEQLVSRDPSEQVALLADSRCFLRHGYLGPFDTEFDVDDDDELESPCRVDSVVHELDSRYAPGDRAYFALEIENDNWHQPLRVYSERVSIR